MLECVPQAHQGLKHEEVSPAEGIASAGEQNMLPMHLINLILHLHFNRHALDVHEPRDKLCHNSK